MRGRPRKQVAELHSKPLLYPLLNTAATPLKPNKACKDMVIVIYN